MDNAEIRKLLKEMLVSRLNLKMKPHEIEEGKPLFRASASGPVDGLSLDSIEALEIVIGIENTFKLKIKSEDYKEEFYSVQTLANFVERLIQQAPGADKSR